ncbi:DUF58 domain-containing protein [Chloroflexales bacterium ZM16-3]|nr:DUF58 domain-containing protein [Chloroflexales bacterium ZM16-3]
MWFKTIFRPNRSGGSQGGQALSEKPSSRGEAPLFDEAFLRRMERMSLQAQRTLRGNPSSGEHPSRHQIPTSIFSDHRPYSSGDDLRYVDWNAYARHDHVLLRLGEAEQDVNVHLLIDASRSMMIGRPPRMRLAQQLVGALGYLALAHSDRLQVVPFGPSAMPVFGPTQGKARMIEMLRFIEGLTPQPATGLASVIRQHARRFPQGGLIVICSDLLSPEGLAEALRSLAPPRWQTLVLHLIDQRDLQPGLQGPLELEDSETGQRLELTLDDETLAAYRRSVAEWREGLARACAGRGATYAPIMSHWPLEQQVVPYLRARRLLR